ncbi:MAG: hypothetical protein FMNOHCHN_03840 [Ignavibacteriaceae bacterium]|nr:hypothetical protein [Ignavibacteriaceae bacterium]
MKTNDWVFKKDKRDTKPCSCIYAKNGKRIGVCLACFESNVYHKERAKAKARQQLIDEVVGKVNNLPTIRHKVYENIDTPRQYEVRYLNIDDIITLLQTIKNSK